MGYRTRNKYSRYRSKSNYGRRRRIITKRSRTNRIMRRALRRRPIPPEIKYSDNIPCNNSPIPPGQNVAFPVSVSSMQVGNVQGARIGSSIRSRMVKLNIRFVGPISSNATPVVAPDVKIRMIAWTPRIGFTDAATYMGNVTLLTVIDFNNVTVLCDQYVSVGAQANGNQSLGDAAGNGAVRSDIVIQKSVRFPRTMRFTATTNNVDPNRDILYMTFINSGANTSNFTVFLSIFSKTTYVDN